jgi:hypothetical protein
MKINSGICV